MTDIVRPEKDANPNLSDPIPSLDHDHLMQAARERVGIDEPAAPESGWPPPEFHDWIDQVDLEADPENEELIDEITTHFLEEDPEATKAIRETFFFKTLAQTASIGAVALSSYGHGQVVEAPLDMYANHVKIGVRSLMGRMSMGYQAWRERPTKGDKAKAVATKSGPWINLMLGESIAVGAQGVAQNLGANSTTSFAIGYGMNMAIDLGTSYASARQFRGNEVSRENLTKSVIEGFFRGGAMGVEKGQLPPKKLWAPVIGYAAFGSLVAGIAELDDNAAKFIEDPRTTVALLATLGFQRICADTFGHTTWTDVQVGRIERFMDYMKARKAGKQTPEPQTPTPLPPTTLEHNTQEAA